MTAVDNLRSIASSNLTAFLGKQRRVSSCFFLLMTANSRRSSGSIRMLTLRLFFNTLAPFPPP